MDPLRLLRYAVNWTFGYALSVAIEPDEHKFDAGVLLFVVLGAIGLYWRQGRSRGPQRA